MSNGLHYAGEGSGIAKCHYPSCSFLSFRSQILIFKTKSALPLRGGDIRTQRLDDTPLTDPDNLWQHPALEDTCCKANLIWLQILILNGLWFGQTFHGDKMDFFMSSKIFRRLVWVLWFQQLHLYYIICQTPSRDTYSHNIKIWFKCWRERDYSDISSVGFQWTLLSDLQSAN